MRIHRFQPPQLTGWTSRLSALSLFLVIAAIPVQASDWPQFLGPNRDGRSPERIATRWPDDGPVRLWSMPLGAGFSSPVVAGGRLFIHHRQDNREWLDCLDAVRGGPPIWRHSTPTKYRDRFGFDEGPRSTPCIAQDRIFTLGAEGTLTAVDLKSGTQLWQVSLPEQFHADQGFFGFACSPLVHEGKVMVSAGGREDAGILAFEAESGTLLWKATRHEAGYSSPVIGRVQGQKSALFFTREGFVALEPATGKIMATLPWRSRQSASVNAASPCLLRDDKVFLSASYGTGAVVLDLKRAPKVIWSGDESLSSHYASVIHHQGHLFGFHGRQEFGPSLRCIDPADGRVLWTEESLGAGTLLLAGDQLLILLESGELIVAKADPDGFRPTARAQVLGSGTRSHAALCEGRWYARDPRMLVCLDLTDGSK